MFPFYSFFISLFVFIFSLSFLDLFLILKENREEEKKERME